jgi:hypothetical protein
MRRRSITRVAGVRANEGCVMSSFEWMELQTLASDIDAARSRLVTARAAKDHRLIRALEQEIAAAEQRRARLVTDITSDVAAASEQAPRQIAGSSDPDLARDPTEPARGSPDEPDGGRQIAGPADRPADRIVAGGAASAAAAPNDGSNEGDSVVWDQLTPGDLERAKGELSTRRSEMLARHAAELAGLDGERSELETLEYAIVAFMRKFNPSSATGAVVRLGEERELRVNGRG